MAASPVTRVRRGAVRALTFALGLGFVAGGLGGCSLDPIPVAVVGRDASGQLVVGATDCGVGSDSELDLTVSGTDLRGGRAAWTARRGAGGGSSAPDPHDDASYAEPTALAAVRLYVVGSSHPDLGYTSSPWREPEIGEVTFDVTIDQYDDLTLRYDPSDRTADRYAVNLDGRVVEGLDGRQAVEALVEECEKGEFHAGPFFTVVGSTAVGALVVAVVIGVFTTRQWRRAGEATRARRSPPTGF